LNPVLLAVALSLIALYYANKLYRKASAKVKVSTARLFLRRDASIHALLLMVAALIVFVAARVVSFLIILGVFSEDVIYTVRAPLDFLVAFTLTAGIVRLYSIIRVEGHAKTPPEPS